MCSWSSGFLGVDPVTKERAFQMGSTKNADYMQRCLVRVVNGVL